jgi:hypothetical protein
MTHDEQHRELAALQRRVHRAMGQDQAIRAYNQASHLHFQLPHGPGSHWPGDHRPLEVIARDRRLRVVTG